MPYYEMRIKAERCVCVKADDEEEAIRIGREEGAGCEWDFAEAEIEDEYGDATEPDAARAVAEYTKEGNFYE